LIDVAFDFEADATAMTTTAMRRHDANS